MSTFHFYKTLEIRFSDLDPLGHVNNAVYLSYFEQARIAYITHLGLWQPGSFETIGMIIAEVRVTYRAPLLLSQAIQVGVRVARLGNKSLTMEYTIEDAQTHQEHTSGSCVMVSYDYRSHSTIPVPDIWRQRIIEFENLASND